MQKLIDSSLKEIFIIILIILFKGKATHRYVRRRRKVLQQCHVIVFTLLSPPQKYEQMEINRSDSFSIVRDEEPEVREVRST